MTIYLKAIIKQRPAKRHSPVFSSFYKEVKMVERLLQGLSLGAGLAVKWYTFVFLRLVSFLRLIVSYEWMMNLVGEKLPIGPRYLPTILSCTLI